MAYHFDGKAIFSTCNGEYARREKIPSMRTILRSNPIEDQQTMVSKLQKDFPEVCKAITAPVTDTDVYEYFDYCDAAVHGFEFLRAVLEYIAGLNASVSAQKATRVQDYVGRWKSANSEAFTYIRPYHALTDLFTKEDIEEHGIEFLTEAMMQIRNLKKQEDHDEARQSALRLQIQHAHMMHNQRSFTQLQAPARSPFPINLSAAQGMRASSNPEHGQPQQQGGLVRHLPGPPGKCPTSQARFPLPRLTSSTEVLEHVYPGSTSRGDFHSDPITHYAMDAHISWPPDSHVAIPSRGLPGPFSYRPLPPPTQPVPLLNRIGTFDGNLPKGKKNPKKTSSDDARMVSNTENGPRQASNGANPKRSFALQNIQLPFYPRSPDAIPLGQEIRPSSGGVPYSGYYQQPNLPPGHNSGNGQETFHHPPDYGQMSMQPAMEGRSRVVSNPYSPAVHELQGPTQDPRPTVLNLPIPTNVRHQGVSAKGQAFEENAGFVSTQVRPHHSQPLDPHAFGHQLPDRQMDAQDRQDPIPEFQRPALAPMPNASQPPFPRTPERSRANENPRRPVQEGCTIWIGGLPKDFDKAAVMHLLRPCRGLLDVSEPRESSPVKYHINRSFAFADFQSPVDAAEALERLPQTRFASLPEGSFLSTNYPRPKLYASPGHCQHGSDGESKRPVSNVSPTKSCKGEDSTRVGKSKIEHGRKSSKGSARGKKQSTSSSEGKTGIPSERVIAVDVGQKESGLQPQEAVAIPDSYGKAGSTAHVSQSGTDGQVDSRPMNQDPALVQPGASVEMHANQAFRSTGDGVEEIVSALSAKPQVQQGHQATSSRHAEGRAKAPKKKSQGSNKLPGPDIKGSEPPLVQPASGNSKPTARARPSANDAGKFLKKSGRLEGNRKQGGSEIEASNMIAPTVPLQSAFTLPKDLETPDQSFLGRNPTEDDGEQPKASVANVPKPSSGENDEAEVSETAPAPAPAPGTSAVSAVPLEPISQAMRRDVSSSTQGSADTGPSILSSTTLSSSPRTERSNSITQEPLSPMDQAACSSSEATLFPGFRDAGQTAREQKSEPLPSLAPSETGKGTKGVQGELQNPTNVESGGFPLGRIEEDLEQAPSMLLIQPSPPPSDRAILRSPARKRAPSIPPRSSSLAAPLTPIKTHQKKKPRNFTPVKEAPSEDDMGTPSKVTGLAVEGTKMGSSVQTTGNTKLNFAVLTVDTGARPLPTDKSKDLPKPETPFLMDDGVRVAPPKISHQTVMEVSNADRYYAQKNNYQVFHLVNAMHINATFNSLNSSDATSTHSSETSTSDHSSTKKQNNDVETILREAGFRSLSGTSPFTIKDPELILLETIDEGGDALEKHANKHGPMLSWVDEKGKIGPGMSLDAWTKQHEMIEVVKKATAVKRLLAGSPPWTKIESLRQQLSQFVHHSFSDAQEQQTTKAEAQSILWAKALLDTTPQRDSSTSEMQKWSRNASRFVEKNASEPSPADAECRKATTNSPGKSSRGTPSQKQQQQRRHPLLINKPDPQTLVRELGKDKDAFQTANPESDSSLISEYSTESEPSPSTVGRRTPSEERLTPSVALIPSVALNQVSKLKDIFAEMGEDRRRWSDDRYRVSTPQEEDRMTTSDPQLRPLGGEFDVRRVTEVKDEEPEPEVKETEDEVQQKPHEHGQRESKGKELRSENEKQDQSVTATSEETRDSTAAGSKDTAPVNSEDPTHQKQLSWSLGVSFPSFDSHFTTSNEGSSGEVHHTQLRGGHSPLKRSGYNAVAGRGIDAKRGGRKEGSKDPWALPQGEKPWGSGGEERGEKKKRQRQ
ncbi:hypothetical protein HO133_004053 [Letharia lupina]|uniref:RRM domain-containing protein n=1 Tax=Letharia lupina TaxID=560253 RepID=A0A8H6CA11_9LECA|nr:uncharacterized protein HO133_004053 [Letharia lupina]KAF6219584.1 hypothetical protein HO133_004053 [Letharia lupina]